MLLIIIIMVEIAVFSQYSNFLSMSNLCEALRAAVEIGIIALGMTFVIMTAGIDLSVGSLLALVSVAIGFSYQAGVPFPLSIVLGIAVGILGGLLNGVLIVYFNLHPFVVTLGTYSLFRGIAYAATNAGAVSVFPEAFGIIGRYYFFGIVPTQVIILIAITIAIWILFKRTPFGTYVSAIGYNEQATMFSGISVKKVKLFVYVLMGLLVAVAAIIYTSRFSTARGNAGIGMELNVIAAAVLGGTDIKGGKGGITGTFLGVVILALLKNGLAMMSVRGDWAMIVTGAVLVIGMLFNRLFEKQND